MTSRVLEEHEAGGGIMTLLIAAILLLFAAPQDWQRTFDVETAALVTSGESRYFVLKPGYRLTLEGRESGKPVKLAITVLDETQVIGGVTTRVVEERESRGGELIEVSRNFLAIHPSTGDVYYFGEDVDMYNAGRVVSHEGAWRHGSNGARFGLLIPGSPRVGMRFYQELAEGVAMDRAEVVGVTDKVRTRAGTFAGCLRTKETTPLEKGATEFKVYAPGVGLVKDGDLQLVSRESPLMVHSSRQQRSCPVQRVRAS
jgi:hypothetical protein